jgi:putative membrane-bound dehydrogenase-like protein
MHALLLAAATLAADITPPKVLDERLQVQLVAAEPDVVTPTGLAVDERGRVLVIESHTHFRPDGYKGPPADRILLMDDFDPATGKARKISVFFEGTTHTMNLAVYYDGSIYVATRSEIFRLRDTNADGQADERTRICHLETAGNYPHNGLSGFAFDFAGNVYFGFGENLGADYKLIGSDGKTLSGGGEGGNIYCCAREGGDLRRVATGFWNPFHLSFDAFGRLFAVDNDPDSRPPCRLLHIVEGGDYGYRFRNGRKGVHPFTAWNGELPGTLPMVAGTGEAPCAVLAYESDNLPEEYRGDLLVTSWGDHRLERYHLKPRGASFSAEMTPVLRGDEHFRPVGLALAPDGSLYFSDWVDKSYNLHGKGRVWRLSAKNPPKRPAQRDVRSQLLAINEPWRDASNRHRLPRTADDVRPLLKDPNPRVRAAAMRELAPLGTRLGILSEKEWRQIVNHDESPDVREVALACAEFFHGFGRPLLDGSWQLLLSMMSPEVPPAVQAAAFRAVRDPSPLPFPGGNVPDEEPALRRLGDSDPFVAQAATAHYATRLRGMSMNEFRRLVSPSRRLAVALVKRRANKPEDEAFIPVLLQDSDPMVQLVGVMWVGEELLPEYAPAVEELLNKSGGNRLLFEGCLAALHEIHGGPRGPKDESPGEAYIAKILENPKSSLAVRRFALRSLRPDHPSLTAERLKELLGDADSVIRLEAIRTVRHRPDSERWPQLREIAAAGDKPAQERCEAILGLSPGNDEDRKLLFDLTTAENAEVADEALRALRGFDLNDGEKERLTALAEKLDGPRKELAQRVLARNPPKNQPRPSDHAAWLALAEGDGNPQAGERIFYHLRVGGCFRCHEFEGRGYQIGPDLTGIGRTMTRERLVQSIVDPSREIAPMFTNWTILTTDGEVKSGIHVGDEVDGRMKFADQNGRVFHVHPNDIDRRQPSSQSVMPESLVENLTPQELRDLLAFLQRAP